MFEKNWSKNVNFLLITYFWASALFYESVPTKKPTRDVNRFQQMISIPYR